MGDVDTKAAFWVPAVTAFDADGGIDRDGNVAVWEHVLDGGVDGVVLMGSTGEFFAMRPEHKRELIDLAVEHVGPRADLVVGTSCLRVDDTVELSRYALDAGADAVIVISPFYFALDDASIEAYFSAVAGQVDGDVYLYNFPARTGHDLSAEVTARLLRRHPNVVGYKDTVLDVGHTRGLLTALLPEFPEFRVLAGFDENLHHVVTSGGAGAIGGLANLYPEICAAYARAVRSGDRAAIAAQQRRVDVLMGLYGLGTPFFPLLKEGMVRRGIALERHCTPPHHAATPEQVDALVALMDRVEAMP
ncbi:dihydrodipicolinate synthase family protein [Actinotalea ferrariae]|uniref:dihydrodipicolinate synthase family protein n=1 Tax=Actinotalea ferrariae TaxID=1386098 RepID=UPI001C8B1BD8|nr:dihydrodipicolinate synthase family protein [Actinotalea ferrariae]MBX9245814.1 dihydrodipicolinate synthase family protein [Actinotalea ferrariae]